MDCRVGASFSGPTRPTFGCSQSDGGGSAPSGRGEACIASGWAANGQLKHPKASAIVRLVFAGDHEDDHATIAFHMIDSWLQCLFEIIISGYDGWRALIIQPQ